MNKRYKLLITAKRSKDPADWASYKTSRNKVTALLREAEMEYWKNELETAQGKDMKSFWNVVKRLTGKEKTSNVIGPILNDDNELEYDDKGKADAFNIFFSTVGSKLAENHPEMPENVHSYVSKITPTLLEVSNIDAWLEQGIKRLDPGKATGVDKITSKEILMLEGVFKESISGIFHKSFPARYKMAKLRMTLKDGQKIERGNYRPLSMLSIPSKLLEGIVCSAIDDHRVYIPNIKQWGYKKGLSTELLLVYLTEKWKMEMDRGKFVGIILIDFRKAFDTVDHSIMQLKLQGVGLANDVAEWINDYLSNRQQFTEINEAKSELQCITHGVPQGSLLGPRLFSIYVEDFPSSTAQGGIELYADDTTAYCTGNSIDEVHESLEKMLNDIQSWCTRHKLTIHTGKTKVLLINRQKFIGPLNELKLGETPIEYVAEAKCLGVKLDQKLSWQPQINHITKSFNAKVKRLKSMKYLPKAFLEQIYFKTIIPSVTYCLAVWGSCSESLFQDVEKIHVRAAKIIHGITSRNTDEDILRKVKWDPISYLYKRKVLIIMQNSHLQRVPDRICDLFDKCKNTKRHLRSGTKFNVPEYRTEAGRNSIRYRGPLLWNTLQNDQKEKTIECFKRSIGKFREQLKKITFAKGTGQLLNKRLDFMYF